MFIYLMGVNISPLCEFLTVGPSTPTPLQLMSMVHNTHHNTPPTTSCSIIPFLWSFLHYLIN